MLILWSPPAPGIHHPPIPPSERRRASADALNAQEWNASDDWGSLCGRSVAEDEEEVAGEEAAAVVNVEALVVEVEVVARGEQPLCTMVNASPPALES